MGQCMLGVREYMGLSSEGNLACFWRSGRHRLLAMVRNAYSYWFGFWYPLTTGRGAIL